MLRTSVCIAAVIVAVGLSAPAFAGQPLSQATDFSSQNKNRKAPAAAKPSGGPKVTRTVTTTRVTTRSGGGQNVKARTVTTTKKVTNKNFQGNPNVKNRTIPTSSRTIPPFKPRSASRVRSPSRAMRSSSRPGPARSTRSRSSPRRTCSSSSSAQFVRAGVEQRAEENLVGQQVEGVHAGHRARRGRAWRRLLLPGRLSHGGTAVLRRASRRTAAGSTGSASTSRTATSDWQCVQFCRRPGNPPPPRTVALVAPPPMPQGGNCQISIYSEPNFGGTNASASEEQPRLNENGWQNQIASVKVAAGTWDFFSAPEFTGETMRLAPGDYPNLGPEWTQEGRLVHVRAAVGL